MIGLIYNFCHVTCLAHGLKGMWYLGNYQILFILVFYMFVKTKSSLSTFIFIFSTIFQILVTRLYLFWTQTCRNWTKLFIRIFYFSQVSHVLKEAKNIDRHQRLNFSWLYECQVECLQSEPSITRALTYNVYGCFIIFTVLSTLSKGINFHILSVILQMVMPSENLKHLQLSLCCKQPHPELLPG